MAWLNDYNRLWVILGSRSNDKGDDCKDGSDVTDPRSGTSDIVTQLVISITLGLSAFTTFCAMRRKWSGLYSARKKQTKQASSLPDLPTTIFGWIPALYRIEEDEVLHAAGLDAFVFLGFFKMAMKIVGVMTFFGLTVMTPLHYFFEGSTGFELGAPGKGSNPCKNDSSATISHHGVLLKDLNTNAEPETSPKSNAWLWSYVIFVYFYTGVALYFLYEQTKKVVRVRQRYLGSQSTITDRTIRISGIPANLREEDKLKEFVEKLGIGKVDSVTICRNWKKLDTLMSKRMDLLRKLEEAWTVYLGGRRVERSSATLPLVQPAPPSPRPESPNERESLLQSSDGTAPYGKSRPTTKLRFGFLKTESKTVDAIDHFTKQLEDLDAVIVETRKKDFVATPMAFVTMDSVAAAQMAVQALLDPNPLRLIGNLAPAPHDIVWSNTYISRRERLLRMWLITIAIGMLTIFWLLPVGTLAGLLNMRTIKRVWPALAKSLASNRVASSLVQTSLPTAVLTILNVAVPYFYNYLSNQQGMISQADVERSLISKNYFFTFFNLFLVFTVFGTASEMYEVLKESLRDTTKIAYRLAESLASFAPFYTNLIILQGIGMFPFRLLEFGTVVLYPITLMGSKTPRDYAELVAPPIFQYGFFLPQPILVLVLCLVYSLLQAGTIMLGFGLIFFSIGYFTYKYQLLYAMDHPQHSTGKAWPMICYRVFFGLLLFQVSVAALLSLQKAFIRGILIVPVLLLTCWVWWMFQRTFSPLMHFIALRSLQEGRLNEAEEDPDNLVRENEDTIDESREQGLKFANPNLYTPLEGIWLAKYAEEEGVYSRRNEERDSG